MHHGDKMYTEANVKFLDEPNQQNSRELNIVIHITIEKEKHMYIQ
jgi:hypothetical protein